MPGGGKDVSYDNIGAGSEDTDQSHETLKSKLRSWLKPQISQQEDKILAQFKLEELPDHDEGDDEEESQEGEGQLLSLSTTSPECCSVQPYKGWWPPPKWIQIDNQKDFAVTALVCLRKKVSQLQEVAPKVDFTVAPPGGSLSTGAAIKLLLYEGKVNSWIIPKGETARFDILSRKGVYIKVFCTHNIAYTLGRREVDCGGTFIIKKKDRFMLQTELEKLEISA